MGTVVMKSVSFQREDLSTSGMCFWCGKLLSRLGVTCMTPCLQSSFDNWAFFIAPSAQKISADWLVLGCFFLWQHSATGLWVGRILTHPWSSSVIAFEAVVVCTSELQRHICYSDTGVFCWSAEQLRVLKYGTPSCYTVNPQPWWKH